MESPIRVRDVRSSRGPAWLAGGWGHFRRAPMVWMGLSAGWMLITLALVLVPLVGGVVANLLQPVFFASFAMAARAQLDGKAPEMGDLFAGFRRPLRPLVNLGAILLAAEIGIFFLMSLMGLPGVGDGEEIVTLVDYAKALQGKEWILVAGVVLTAIVKGALWFAPALVWLWLEGASSLAPTVATIASGVIVYAALARLLPGRQFWHDIVCDTRLVEVVSARAATAHG